MLLKSVFELAGELLDAEAAGQRRELVDRLSTIDVLALDDFGMKTLRTTAAEDLLDIIMRRHERLPTIITTNRPTQDWAQFLGDVPAATAILGSVSASSTSFRCSADIPSASLSTAPPRSTPG